MQIVPARSEEAGPKVCNFDNLCQKTHGVEACDHTW